MLLHAAHCPKEECRGWWHCAKHGHYRFYEVKAIVKAIIGQKNWPSQWSRQFLFFCFSSQSLGQLFVQINGQVNCQANHMIKKKSQVNCQVNYVAKFFFSSQLSSQLFCLKNIILFKIIVIFWLMLVDYCKNLPIMLKYGQSKVL